MIGYGLLFEAILKLQLAGQHEVPSALADRYGQVASELADLDLELPPRLAASAARVLIASDFVLGVLLRQPEMLVERLADTEPVPVEWLIGQIDLVGCSEEEAMAILRRRRQVEMARIAWFDLAGWATFEQSLEALSVLADSMIRIALEHATRLMPPKYGIVEGSDGRPAPLLVLGMGKLGGYELNFSSDIDLVFLHPDELTVVGGTEDDIEPYFRRLAQIFIKLLDFVTEDGFVFRVDTRLRPFGASGPLAIGLSAFEAYLIKHGRDWERYAYLKARLINGPEFESQIFSELLSPFVYRRYLDFGAFDALRQMKRLIINEVNRKDMQGNIKLGPGGIREVEFIAQVFQLARGGKETRLRTRRLLTALRWLGELDILSSSSVDGLTQAYRYLRTVENRLQAMNDQQTHDLPTTVEKRERLAYAMAVPTWADLEHLIGDHRAAVSDEFARVARDADTAEGSPESRATAALVAAWDAADLDELLAKVGLKDDAAIAQSLSSFRQSSLYQRMDEPSRQRLALAIAGLLPRLASQVMPAVVLGRVLPILEAICRRSAYLALLNENPLALDRLSSLAGQSPLLAGQMAEHPLLLDELLDARLFDAPPSRSELKQSLQQLLRNVAQDDTEEVLNAVRQFQRAAVFRIAIADRIGGLPLMRVSDRLTDTAELVLELALTTALRELEAKHGQPMHGEPEHLEPAGFAIIAYGKLGGFELGYGSDLDVVFLHGSTGSIQETSGPRVIDNQRFFARVAQRLIHFLTIQTSSGRLYEIDTRLRPSGGSGAIVASLASFQKYQREQAWTWEHQALLRSRAVAGQPDLCAAFERGRREILVQHVNRDGLRDAIVTMRTRMRTELSVGTAERFDLKQDPGGLADIEFLVDYWVLSNAPKYPDLIAYPDKIRQLEALRSTNLVSAETCRDLTEAYLVLRARIHELALTEGQKLAPMAEFRELRAGVVEIWKEVFGNEAETGRSGLDL